jgi:hypothetical protein
MSPADLDGLLRSELTRNAERLDDLDTRGALVDVLHGSARRTRRRLVVYAVAAVVVAILSGAVVAALPRQQQAPAPVTPVQPHGAYERTVASGPWTGDWSITLDDGRVLRLAPPPGVSAEQAPADGASYRLTPETLTVDAFANGACTEQPPGSYTWTEVGGGLLLQPRDETCVPRRAVFAGLWQPAP